jgi:capsular exopolysaccharide synthesis family protein
VERLSVLPAGSRSQNPSELVGSVRLRSVLEGLSGMFDLIIFDTPPVLLASEAAILSKQVDGVLVVVRAGRTERELARRAVHQLTVVGARVVGTVLNDPDAEDAKYGASYGYYNHDA